MLAWIIWFQHTAARRRLPSGKLRTLSTKWFQHTAARRRLPKTGRTFIRATSGFNTQPRGGGCIKTIIIRQLNCSFNTQPRGGGCSTNILPHNSPILFQHTAARRRLQREPVRRDRAIQSFNTQPRGGGCLDPYSRGYKLRVSTHSRAEAAANFTLNCVRRRLCFNTQPRGGGCSPSPSPLPFPILVSTHSRAEAAARRK